jgi:hypothetical protein
VPIIDERAILDAPVLGKFRALLAQIRFEIVSRELGRRVRVQTVPAGEIIAIENGPKALRRSWFRGRTTRSQGQVPGERRECGETAGL